MRKVIFCLILDLLILSALVAGDIGMNSLDFFPGCNEPDSVSVELTLDVTPEDMYYYAFGFVNDGNDKALGVDNRNILPKGSAETIELEYDPNTAKAYNKVPLYLFYKARTGIPFDLKLSMDGNLESKNAPDLRWFIDIISPSIDNNSGVAAVFSCNTLDSLSNISAVAKIEASNLLHFGAYELQARTDVIPLLDNRADYNGSLTITVSVGI